MKFLLDANMPDSSINIFKKFDYKAEHSKKIGLGTASDKDLINYAVKNHQILITRDLDFGNIFEYPINSHIGIVILKLPFYYTA